MAASNQGLGGAGGREEGREVRVRDSGIGNLAASMIQYLEEQMLPCKQEVTGRSESKNEDMRGQVRQIR